MAGQERHALALDHYALTGLVARSILGPIRRLPPRTNDTFGETVPACPPFGRPCCRCVAAHACSLPVPNLLEPEYARGSGQHSGGGDSCGDKRIALLIMNLPAIGFRYASVSDHGDVFSYFSAPSSASLARWHIGNASMCQGIKSRPCAPGVQASDLIGLRTPISCLRTLRIRGAASSVMRQHVCSLG